MRSWFDGLAKKSLSQGVPRLPRAWVCAGCKHQNEERDVEQVLKQVTAVVKLLILREAMHKDEPGSSDSGSSPIPVGCWI